MKTKLTHAASKYGAQMGRPNRIPKDITKSTKLDYEKLKWVDGDYDRGGAYWGGGMGDYIYRAQGKTETENVEIFVRAKTLKEAKKQVAELLLTSTECIAIIGDMKRDRSSSGRAANLELEKGVPIGKLIE